MPTLLVDLDAVSADFIGGLLSRYNAKHSPPLSAEDLVDYKFDTYLKPEIVKNVVSIFQEPGFFINLHPTPHAVETIQQLLGDGHQIEICTAPPHSHTCSHAAAEKLDWVIKWFPELKGQTSVTSNKFRFDADMLVDDFKDNIEAWCAKRPDGVGYLIDLPWNRAWTELPPNVVRGGLKDVPAFLNKFWCPERGKFGFRTAELRQWPIK